MMRAIRILSFTAPGRSYAVGPRAATSDLACDCPAFRRDRPCKHIKVYVAVEHAVARCRRASHLASLRMLAQIHMDDGEMVCPTCFAAALVASARKSKARTRSALDDLKARLKARKQKKERAR